MPLQIPDETPEIALAELATADDGRPALDALGNQMRSGVAWKTASQIISLLARTAMTVILAHLLSPRDFGVAGMVLVFNGLIELLTDLGFSASLMQFKSLDEDDRSTAFWTSVLIGSLCFAISFAVAPYVASFYGEPRVRWMFVAVAAGFLTSSLTTTQATLIWRKMDFRALEIRAIAATVLSATVGVVAAFAGLGAWSLILQSLSMGMISMITIWALSPWKPRLTFSIASLRRMGSFNSKILGARFMHYGDRNMDNLLIARFLGPGALGIYSIAYSVIVIPFERLVGPVQNILIPAFASLQDDLAAMRALWMRSVRLTTAIILPAMAGVIVVAPDAVHVILGTRWAKADVVIQILAWVAIVQSFGYLNGPIYQSRFRGGLLLRFAGAAFALDLTAFVVGLHWGVRGVAAAYAVTNTLLIAPANFLIVRRLLETGLRALAAELRGVLEATGAMVVSIFGVRQALVHAGVTPAPRLAILIAVGMVVYLLMCRWRDRRVFAELHPRRLRNLATV